MYLYFYVYGWHAFGTVFMNNTVFTDNESNATLQDVLVLRLGLMNHHLWDLTQCLTWNSQWESFHCQTHVV